MFGNTLFGNNQQKPATGGLLENKTPQTGGIFGQTSNQPEPTTNLWGSQGIGKFKIINSNFFISFEQSTAKSNKSSSRRII